MNDFASKHELYAALIGDVVESRRYGDRVRLQRDLQGALARVNERAGEALASPLTLTAGDEIQGLFRDPAALVDAVVEIADAVDPARLVHGLGLGALDTDLGPDPALLDGPCFHRAREAVDEARRIDVWLVARGLGEAGDAVVTALFRLLGELRLRWTAIQAEHVRLARRISQKEVAERLGKAESTVSESLHAAAFQTTVEAERALRLYLHRFGNLTESDNSSPRRSKKTRP